MAHSDQMVADHAKSHIFAGSILAGIVGTIIFRTAKSTPDPTAAELEFIDV